MNFNERTLILIYNFEDRGGREALAYAKSINDNIEEYDISKTRLTARHLAEIIKRLDVSATDLVNPKSDHYYKVEGKDFEEMDLLALLAEDHSLLKTPIVVMNNRGVICNIPSDVLRLAPEKGGGKDINEA
mgnify:CR=1 FL=1